jgi:hypothetical protein
MMRFIFLAAVVFLLATCTNNDREILEPEISVGDTILVWETNADSMIMVRDRTVPDSAITINRIINGLNEKYPEIHIDLVKRSGDTAYIDIPNGEYLGNQMGSAGASAWFADATINITSVSGINYVSFRMDIFSHAGSTVIGSNEYKNWKKQ